MDSNETCIPNLSGFNSISTPRLDPIGPIFEKYPSMAAGNTPDLYHEITRHWIERRTYESLLEKIRIKDSKSYLRSLSLGLRVAVRLKGNGELQLQYASPTVYSSERTQDGQVSSVLATGISTTGEVQFSLSMLKKGVSQGANVENQRQDDPTSDECQEDFYEYILPYGFQLSKLIFADQFHRSELKIVPSLEVLRTQIGRLPDHAFVSRPSDARSILTTLIDNASSSYLSGNTIDVAKIMNSISIQLKALISANYSPSDGLEISQRDLLGHFDDAYVRTVASGENSKIRKNGFLKVTEITMENQDRTFSGIRLTSTLNPEKEILVRVIVDGVQKSVNEFSDGTFLIRVPSASGQAVRFEARVRSKRAAKNMSEGLSETNHKVALLKTAKDLTLDPDRKAQIQKEIDRMELRVNKLIKGLESLELGVGQPITFTQ